MSEWQPIATVPDDVQSIEGSFDGKTFHGLYSRTDGGWLEYDGLPAGMTRLVKPPFWRLTMDERVYIPVHWRCMCCGNLHAPAIGVCFRCEELD